MARVSPRDVVARYFLPSALWDRHWPLLLPAVGRRLQWRLGRGPITFTLQSLAVSPGLLGRLRSVHLTANDVDIDGVRLERVTIVAQQVRLRGTSVFARHVELRVRMDQRGLDALLESGLPYAKLRLDGDVGRAELLAHPRWGHVELAPRVEDGGLILQPIAVGNGSRARWTAPAKLLPRLRIGSCVLLPGSRLTAAEVRDSELRLTAELEDLTMPLLARDDDEAALIDLREPAAAPTPG
jgi:hypothetical protein